jgi:hypothetical protein
MHRSLFVHRSACSTALVLSLVLVAQVAGADPTTPPEASIVLGDVTGPPGDRVTVTATLHTAVAIAGTQNDIGFFVGAVIAAGPNGRPDCAANPAINKPATSFAFRPNGCTPGRDCTSIRALVLSTDNVDPIEDAAVLYSCTVSIGDATPPGSYPLALSGAIASDPNGSQVPFSSADGAVIVITPAGTTPLPTWTVSPTPSPQPPTATRTPFPTFTPVPTRGPTYTPRPSVEIDVGSATVAPDGMVAVAVTLASGVYPVAGVQADIAVDRGLSVAALPDGKPDCQVNPDINKPASAFSFEPFGCQPGVNCRGVRALVLAVDNVDPIADGAVLFTCGVRVAVDTPPGTYSILLSGVVAGDPNGETWGTIVHSGEINVVTPPGATPIPTWTPGPVDVSAPPSPRLPGAGSPCDPSTCATGFCVDGMCCDSDACSNGERCDIFGAAGTCAPPQPENTYCEKQTDCADGLVCQFRVVPNAFLCLPPPLPTPTFIPFTPNGTPLPPLAAVERAATSSGGCNTVPGGHDAGACVLVIVPLLLVVLHRLCYRPRMILAKSIVFLFTTAALSLWSLPTWAGATAAECESAQVCVGVSSVEGAPGTTVGLDVTLLVDQADTTTIQNQVILPPGFRIAAQADGEPDCTVDAAIAQPYDSFVFLPASCAPDLDCVGVRAFVDSPAAFGSGRVVYRCTVLIAADAAPGRYPIHVGGLSALSDGYPVCAINGGTCDPLDPAYSLLGLDGEISVLGPPGGTPLATSTPQPTRTPTPTETPCAPYCPGVVVGSASAVPGEEVTIPVTFRGGWADVSGVQVDIRFDPSTPIVGCRVNPAIDKGFSAFSVKGDRARAAIFGLDPDVVIADGAVLYTCTVAVAADAAPGAYRLLPTNVLGSTAVGHPVPMSADPGQVVVSAAPPGATPIPTRTLTATWTPLPTPIEIATPSLAADTVRAAAGERVTVAVRFFGGNPYVQAMQNDLTFEPAAFVASGANGKPDCTVDPSIGASDAAFAALPIGCQLGGDCHTIRAEIIRFTAPALGAPGSALYSCTFSVNADTPPGLYPLHLSGGAVTDPDGNPLPLTLSDGAVQVLAPVDTTPRPTWTAHPTPTATATPAPAVSIAIGSAVGAPGTLTAVQVRIGISGPVSVAGIEQVIDFDSAAPIVACAANPNLTATRIVFAFEPSGCDPNIDCYQVRASLTVLDPAEEIRDGEVLYTCTISIRGMAAAGLHQLVNYVLSVTDTNGAPLVATATDGAVTVVAAPSPAQSSTPQASAAGQAPTSGGGGGCSLGPPRHVAPARFLLLGGLPWLWWVRRRRTAR